MIMREFLVLLTVALVFALIMVAGAATVLYGDNLVLAGKLNSANAELASRGIVRPSESECVAWLFNSDLQAAKQRMCGRQSK